LTETAAKPPAEYLFAAEYSSAVRLNLKIGSRSRLVKAEPTHATGRSGTSKATTLLTSAQRPPLRLFFTSSHHEPAPFTLALPLCRPQRRTSYAMRFLSFFTRSLSSNTPAAAFLVSLSLCAASVRAQDRTTEAGEASIKGVYFLLVFLVAVAGIVTSNSLCDLVRYFCNKRDRILFGTEACCCFDLWQASRCSVIIDIVWL
jgi:hypothetical protein